MTRASAATTLRVIVNDYSGHPFQYGLARELARRGHSVEHEHCSHYVTGHGDLRAEDGLEVRGLGLDSEVDRYRAGSRLRGELVYARESVRRLRAVRPDVVLLSNLPFVAQPLVAISARLLGVRVVMWHQDVYSIAVRRLLGARSRVLGSLVGGVAALGEALTAHLSSQVVVISEAFWEDFHRPWRVPRRKVHVVPNWAPVEDIAPGRPDRELLDSLGVPDGPLVTYSGTLGLKHNPEVLVQVADAVRPLGATVLVVTEGKGRAYLEEDANRRDNLVLRDFLPFDEAMRVQGASDVLVCILEPEAGRFSVPSKVLTYLCLDRPVLGFLPLDNDAAVMIEEAGAGAVVAGYDVDAAAEFLRARLAPSAREEAVSWGRRYAEEHFAAATIADRFEAILTAARRVRRRRPAPAASSADVAPARAR